MPSSLRGWHVRKSSASTERSGVDTDRPVVPEPEITGAEWVLLSLRVLRILTLENPRVLEIACQRTVYHGRLPSLASAMYSMDLC